MGGGGSNKSSTEVKLPSWAEPTAREVLGRGQALSDSPYQAYQGQQIAGLNNTQFDALGATAQRAQQGNALSNQAQNYLQGTLSSPTWQNPHQGQQTDRIENPMIGQRTDQIGNQYIGATTNVGANQYAGENPYFESALGKTLDDVQSRVNTQFGNPNAWGSSGHTEVMSRELGNTANQMRMGQYDRSEPLSESDFGRRLQAQQTDLARNSGLADSQAARFMGAQQGDFQRDAGLLDSQAARFMGAQQQDIARNAGLASDAYQFDRSTQMQAAGMSPQFAAQDYNDLQAWLGVGDAYRSYEQDLLNQGYGDWQQAAQHPYRNLDTLSSALQSATRGFQSSTQSAPGGSNLAGALGGGMAGYGLASMFDQNPYAGAGIGALAGAFGS